MWLHRNAIIFNDHKRSVKVVANVFKYRAWSWLREKVVKGIGASFYEC